MNDLQSMPDLSVATKQLEELQSAIAAGNYSAIQEILLHQALTLHRVGMGFIEQSSSMGPFSVKRACIDLGLRALGQSQKTMVAMKMIGR